MKSKLITYCFIIFTILISTIACLKSSEENLIEKSHIVSPTNTQTLTSIKKSEKNPIPTEKPKPTITIQLEVEEIINSEITATTFRELWVSEIDTDLVGINSQSVIGPPGALECNDRYESWYNDQPEISPTEYILTLKYAYPLIPDEVVLHVSNASFGNVRIEILDSSSGIGTEIYDGAIDTGNVCPGTMSISVDSKLSIDTIILAFRNTDPPVHIDAVNLLGILPNLIDIPLFWRIPIPADHLADPESDFPGGLATDEFGNIFVANGKKGLFRYDVEGNLLYEYPVPTISNIRDVALDNQGRIIITDLAYKWYVTFDQEGIQVDAGGEDFGWNGPREIAVHPKTGNIYILDETDEYSHIRVYSPENNQLLKDIPLETIGLQMHKGLAFDPSGYLYTIDQKQALILKINPESGEIIDYLGYEFLNNVSPADLAIDLSGRIYLLLRTSPDDCAVYIIDANGSLIGRLGELTYDGSNWQEGVFFFPVGISISPDGQYLSIIEVGYLSTYLWNNE